MRTIPFSLHVLLLCVGQLIVSNEVAISQVDQDSVLLQIREIKLNDSWLQKQAHANLLLRESNQKKTCRTAPLILKRRKSQIEKTLVRLTSEGGATVVARPDVTVRSGYPVTLELRGQLVDSSDKNKISRKRLSITPTITACGGFRIDCSVSASNGNAENDPDFAFMLKQRFVLQRQEMLVLRLPHPLLKSPTKSPHARKRPSQKLILIIPKSLQSRNAESKQIPRIYTSPLQDIDLYLPSISD